MRKGHDGLCAIVDNELKIDFTCGAIFLFVNKSRRLCKCLYFDGTGLVIIHKRIESGSFMNFSSFDEVQSISMSELALIFEGARLRLPLSPKRMKIYR
jgi:transposase